MLDGKDIHDQIMKMIDQSIEEQVKRFLPAETVHDEWNLQGLKDYYLGWLLVPEDLTFTKQEIEELEPEFVIKTITDRAHLIYENREKQFGETITRELERVILLKNVDSEWMDHIDAMDDLMSGVGLRAYAQKNPVTEYQIEGYDMFDEMVHFIREDTVRRMYQARINIPQQRREVAEPKETNLEQLSLIHI